MASARGHVEITKILYDAAPDMCLSRDSQGRNPIHLAAVKGHIGVLEELVLRAPLTARETAEQGFTVLHLCVKYGQFEALEFLVREMKELIDEKNDDGDTILQMAIKGKKDEIVKHLLQEAEARLKQSKPDPTDSRIQRFFKTKFRYSANPRPEKWLAKKRDSIMVVAILIATMAFQAGVTPAGGVWQEAFTTYENGTLAEESDRYRAGESVMAINNPEYYKNFTISNTVAFVSSLSTILLLISGLPFRRPLFMWVLMVIMWLTVTSIAATFAISILAVTPNNEKQRNSLRRVLTISLAVWTGVMGILLVGNTVRLIDRWLKSLGVVCWRPKWFRSSVEVSHGNGEHQESV